MIGDTEQELSEHLWTRDILVAEPGVLAQLFWLWRQHDDEERDSEYDLIVCATLMGRTASVTRDDNWRNYDEPMPNADSHVANAEYEYIVFDEAQIVLCYVIHLDWGAEQASKFLEDVLDDPEAWIERQKKKTRPRLLPKVTYAGDLEREKAAKQAAAAKWFPYGYGPAKGTRFVIEEIRETSDYEEN